MGRLVVLFVLPLVGLAIVAYVGYRDFDCCDEKIAASGATHDASNNTEAMDAFVLDQPRKALAIRKNHSNVHGEISKVCTAPCRHAAGGLLVMANFDAAATNPENAA